MSPAASMLTSVSPAISAQPYPPQTTARIVPPYHIPVANQSQTPDPSYLQSISTPSLMSLEQASANVASTAFLSLHSLEYSQEGAYSPVPSTSGHVPKSNYKYYQPFALVR